MISHAHKFIFIHIPKTGGLSVVDALMPYCDEKEYTHGHPYQSTYYDFCDAENYYQFSFVRNPFSRLVSSYTYLKKGGICKYDEKARDRLGLQNKTFEEFVKDFNPMDSAVHLMPQVRFFNKDIDKVKIFKLENIQSDFSIICDKIGIEKKKVPHINKSDHRHWREYYNEETINVVSCKYAEDLELFKYGFR